ncbi:hypothetical protein QE152_g33296 [Popillia japonica]|uniref:Uncharacterized protein n=1 Tax=Popillia japonica TaxID=7064 RepID=A0AAW1IX83_POPJA
MSPPRRDRKDKISPNRSSTSRHISPSRGSTKYTPPEWGDRTYNHRNKSPPRRERKDKSSPNRSSRSRHISPNRGSTKYTLREWGGSDSPNRGSTKYTLREWGGSDSNRGRLFEEDYYNKSKFDRKDNYQKRAKSKSRRIRCTRSYSRSCKEISPKRGTSDFSPKTPDRTYNHRNMSPPRRDRKDKSSPNRSSRSRHISPNRGSTKYTSREWGGKDKSSPNRSSTSRHISPNRGSTKYTSREWGGSDSDRGRLLEKDYYNKSKFDRKDNYQKRGEISPNRSSTSRHISPNRGSTKYTSREWGGSDSDRGRLLEDYISPNRGSTKYTSREWGVSDSDRGRLLEDYYNKSKFDRKDIHQKRVPPKFNLIDVLVPPNLPNRDVYDVRKVFNLIDVLVPPNLSILAQKVQIGVTIIVICAQLGGIVKITTVQNFSPKSADRSYNNRNMRPARRNCKDNNSPNGSSTSRQISPNRDVTRSALREKGGSDFYRGGSFEKVKKGVQ